MKTADQLYDEQSEEDRKRCTEAIKRYLAASHGIQSGIAMQMNYDPSFVSVKHLRTGIDTGKAELLGLATLLMNKGMFTMLEYNEAMAQAAENEKVRWEKELSKLLGSDISLG